MISCTGTYGLAGIKGSYLSTALVTCAALKEKKPIIVKISIIDFELREKASSKIAEE